MVSPRRPHRTHRRRLASLPLRQITAQRRLASARPRRPLAPPRQATVRPARLLEAVTICLRLPQLLRSILPRLLGGLLRALSHTHQHPLTLAAPRRLLRLLATVLLRQLTAQRELHNARVHVDKY